MFFDPRVKPKSGQTEDELRRVWNAENVKIALEAYEAGIPLIDKPFLSGQPWLRKPNLLYEWSEWELQEAIKCKNDILYFADTYVQLFLPDNTYGPITLRPYQRKYLKQLQENRFNIFVAARQVGKTVTSAIFLLWCMIFEPYSRIAVLGDKFATAAENVQKIKDIYIRLPFFLKPGITTWNKSTVAFDQNSYVFAGPCTLSTIVGRTISILYFDELAIPDDSQSRPVVEFAFPTVSALQNSRIICTSSPRGTDNIFYELYQGAVQDKNGFKPFKVEWYEVPGRDEKWKEQQVAILGERGFLQQYGNAFLSDDNSWLTEEAIEYMQQLMWNAKYTKIKLLTDDMVSIAKLSKVEPVVMKSKYVNKSTIKPRQHLVDMMMFDKEQVESLSKLKTMPLLFIIDSGEGRLNDFTVIDIFTPEFGTEQERMLQESYAEEISEIELNASKEDYDDEDDMFDAMVDDEVDLESFDGDYLLNNTVRCRQIGMLSSSEHCIPMVALYLQVFIKCFCNPDKVKIVCELDGCGSVMHTMLSTDIVKNSALDPEMFGTCEKKGNPGVYMRGKNKNNYIGATESLIADGRILCSYGGTIFELGKFKEVKTNKWMGVGAHDDQTMTVIQCGAYMISPDFKVWVEDLMSPDPEPGEEEAEDYEDIYAAVV